MAESTVIKSIRAKVESLMAENRRLRSEYDKLDAKRARLVMENREMTEKMAQMEKRVAILELKEGFGGSSDNSKRARARVNRLMREVDKCIALLNR